MVSSHTSGFALLYPSQPSFRLDAWRRFFGFLKGQKTETSRGHPVASHYTDCVMPTLPVCVCVQTRSSALYLQIRVIYFPRHQLGTKCHDTKQAIKWLVLRDKMSGALHKCSGYLYPDSDHNINTTPFRLREISVTRFHLNFIFFPRRDNGEW